MLFGCIGIIGYTYGMGTTISHEKENEQKTTEAISADKLVE